MKNLLIVLLVIISFSVHAKEWVSPIDTKYKAKNPKLFSEILHVREILNSWRGQNEKLREANTLLKNILQKDENFAPAYRELGRLYIMAGYIKYDDFQKGSLNSAEASILKSIKIEPRYEDSYVLLGALYTDLGRYKDAEKALNNAEALGSKSPWFYLNWGELLVKNRQYNVALTAYQHVVKKGTQNKKAYASALSGITLVYLHTGQYDKANEAYKKEIAYEPDDAWTRGNYSAFLLYLYNDVDGAIASGEKALSIMKYGMGQFTLACALYTKWALLLQDKKNSSKAHEYFEKAWKLYPYPEKVIEKTRKNKYTKITALELQKWLTTASSRRRH